MSKPVQLAIAAVASAAGFFLREVYWPLAWVAPVPLLFVAYTARSYRAAAWTTVLSITVWGVAVAATLFGEAGPAVLLRLFPMIAIVAALYSFAIALARFSFLTQSAYAALFAFPVLDTAVSFVAVLLSGGDTAGQAANSQVDAPVLVQRQPQRRICRFTCRYRRAVT